MNKKTSRIVKIALSLVIAVCLWGGFGTIKTTTFAETVTSTKWNNPTTESLTANDDTGTGFTTLSGMTAWGSRMYYNQKLTLDGLTVTIGSTNMVASSRFGFGFTNDAGGYTPQSGPFNVTVVPSRYSGQDCVYFNSTHADGTIVYTADTFAVGVCNVDGSVVDRFISAPSNETRYSISFKYMGQFSADLGDYWQATITLEKGNTFRSNLQSATIAFLESSLNGILDDNRQCYLSAFGMENAGDFYVGIVTAEEKAVFEAADNALQNYQTARTTGSSIVDARSQAVAKIEALPEASKAEYQEKLATIDAIDGNWVPAFGTCAAATYDVNTGYATLTPKEYGQRIYYTQKVKLDGLTVKIGSKNMVAGSRFGFGITNYSPTTDGNYTPETGPFNVTVVPSEYEGQNSVYFNSTHASGTIVYLTDTTTAGVCSVNDSVQNRFVSATCEETVYSITFTYRGAHPGGFGNYWSATITLETGSNFAGLTSAKVDFLDASLNGILDSNGQCYLSAFGMGSAGAFYMSVQDSTVKSSVEEAKQAEQEYRAAILNGQNEETAKAAFLSAIESLPTNEKVSYTKTLNELELQEVKLQDVSQSASVTVGESLSLNYKIAIPEDCSVARFTLTSMMRGESIEQTEADASVDSNGRYVFKAQEVTPQYMSETVTLTFTAYDTDGNTVFVRNVEYSIREYCEKLLSTTTDTKLQTALVDMLNYGAAAQKYVNRNDNLANANISSYQSLATAFNANGASDVLAVQQGSNVTFTAVALSLEDKVSVYARFESAKTNLTATVQIGSNEATSAEIVKVGEGQYYVVCDDLAPTQYADNVMFRVSVDGVEDAACRYSVNSYVSRKYNDTKCGEVVKALYSYGVGVSSYVSATSSDLSKNAIKDVLFANGATTYLPKDAELSSPITLKTGANKGTPSWLAYQWNSGYDISGNRTVNNGVYTYTDSAKTLSLDTLTGSVYMEINGEVEYAEGDRSQVSTPWPHLLLQQDYYGEDLINLSKMSSLRMQMSYVVTKCDDRMQGKVDAGNLHCAQFVWYLTLQNRTEGHDDFGQYIWFGMILFDNREQGQTFTLTYKVDDDSTGNTGMLMCQPASSDWSSTGKMPSVGERINVNFDILKIAQEAFNKAQKTYGLLPNSSWADMYIGSMNFGIELPGTYNIGVQIDDIGLMYTENA